jgi:hypothetical protein
MRLVIIFTISRENNPNKNFEKFNLESLTDGNALPLAAIGKAAWVGDNDEPKNELNNGRIQLVWRQPNRLPKCRRSTR